MTRSGRKHPAGSATFALGKASERVRLGLRSFHMDEKSVKREIMDAFEAESETNERLSLA